jgi:hypothetical protein
VPERQHHPVRHLQELFAVVAGVAFVLSVDRILDTSKHGFPIRWGAVPLFVAFGVTALTYFHDTTVYLDQMYVEKRLGRMPPARALADLTTGSIYLYLLIVLSIEIDRPLYFTITLLLLLGAGEARVLITWSLSHRMLDVERAFLVTTAGALLGILASLLILDAAASDSLRDAVLKGVVLGFTVARTSMQYVLGYEAYFPPD